MHPNNWPVKLEHLEKLFWKEEASAYYLKNLSKFTDVEAFKPQKMYQLSIQKLSEDHPSTGYGLFAAEYIPPFTYILDYNGNVQLDELISSENDYCIHLHDALSVEAETSGNAARFINDFYKIASRPNVAFDTYRCGDEVRVGVWSLNVPIEIGQELLVTYGLDFWESRGVRRKDEFEWDGSWDTIVSS